MNAPASIRNRNPGAQWPGKSSRALGSAVYEQLRDGQKNQMATFATSVQGAAALFHLLDRVYKGKTVSEAIAKWSGGNHVNAYLVRIERLSSISRHDYIDDDLLASADQSTDLAKAMAEHEAGMAYPMSDDEWREAHALFINIRDGKKVEVAKARPKDRLMTAALDMALSHVGEREIPGPDHNQFIVDCFAEVGRPEIMDDETAWCAAFTGTMLKRAGYAYLEKELGARRHLDYGIPISEPEAGAVVVEWRTRPDSWQGHVGFVESYTADSVTMISGNDGNAVSRKTVPRVGPNSKVLGYRRPIPAKAPISEIVASPSMKLKATGAVAGIGMFFTQIVDVMQDGAAMVGEIASGLWVDAPAIATGVTSQVAAGQSLSHALSLPWPVYVAAGIAAAALAVNVYETYQRKRNRNDAETAPTGAAG